MSTKATKNLITLNNLSIGETCTVNLLTADGIIRRRFLDLGLINGTEVKALTKSPSGDPIAYLIRGAVIAIRCEDACKIIVETI